MDIATCEPNGSRDTFRDTSFVGYKLCVYNLTKARVAVPMTRCDVLIVWCLREICPPQVIGMLKDKLILPSSYAAVKVAGLYLLSDILHNTGAPVKHASTYRCAILGQFCACPVSFFPVRYAKRDVFLKSATSGKLLTYLSAGTATDCCMCVGYCVCWC
jgi:hypothetical protein